MPGTMDFGDFLNKMGNETSSRKNKFIEPKPVFEETRPQRREPKKRTLSPVENDFIEPVKETVREEVYTPKSRINEEFMDKAYDYAQGVIKVVRQNFKSSEERVVMLESLNKAIVYYLNSVGVQTSQTQFVPNTQTVSEGSIWNGQTISDDEWNNMSTVQNAQIDGAVKMNDLTGQSVNIQPPTGNYNKNLKIGIKITPDGKQEADLSGVTATDINEMKVLAGMIGPEAENRERELLAAKQAVTQQITEKANQKE